MHSLQPTRRSMMGPTTHSGYSTLWWLEPKIDLASLSVIGLELRLGRRSIRGVVYEAASQRGPEVLRASTLTILREALDLIRELQASGMSVELAVDLLPSCIDTRSTQVISELLRRYDVRPGTLRFEISERSSSVDLLHAAEPLHLLHHLGVGLTLDEFGCGLVRRSEIDKLPIDELKIHRSELTDTVGSQNRLQAIQDLAEWGHCLGFGMVADAIDDEHQLGLVHAAGFDAAQGAALAAPVKSDRIHTIRAQKSDRSPSRTIKTYRLPTDSKDLTDNPEDQG